MGIVEKKRYQGSSFSTCAGWTKHACQVSISKDGEGPDCNLLNSVSKVNQSINTHTNRLFLGTAQ